MEKFESALTKAASKSNWVRWLITDDTAQETLKFMRTSYSNLAPNEQSKWVKRVSKGEEDQIEATIYELVTIELLRRLQLAPIYNPSIERKTPDIHFKFSGQEFLADVFVTHSPKKTVNPKKHRITKIVDDEIQVIKEADVIAMTDKGDRAQKIEGILAKKIQKYDKIGVPLVLFVFLGDHYALRIRNVEEALFGNYYTEGKFTKDELLVSIQDNRPASHGLFLRKIVGLPHPSRNLSAVIACDWFDSPNRQDPGKRLDCLVVHYWDAVKELPSAAFGNFPQIMWTFRGSDIWQWEYTIQEPLVAKLPSTGGIEFCIYTADDPC